MKISQHGQGKLFMDPDPDNARAFFRHKSRRKAGKAMALKDAIGRFAVQRGDAPSRGQSRRALFLGCYN